MACCAVNHYTIYGRRVDKAKLNLSLSFVESTADINCLSLTQTNAVMLKDTFTRKTQALIYWHTIQKVMLHQRWTGFN